MIEINYYLYNVPINTIVYTVQEFCSMANLYKSYTFKKKKASNYYWNNNRLFLEYLIYIVL